MNTVYIPGHNRPIAYKATYDTSSFVNDGEFFDTHPGVTPNVTRYENRDTNGKLIESWERNKSGKMINVTQRDKLYAELEAAQEALEKTREEMKDDKG